MPEQQNTRVLWELRYTEQHTNPLYIKPRTNSNPKNGLERRILICPDTSAPLVFDDSILECIQSAWRNISGEKEGFMVFEDREAGAYDDDEYVE